jgi:hypothetical protein
MLLSFRIGFFVRKSDLFDLPSPKLSILILFAEWEVPEFNFQSILQGFGLIYSTFSPLKVKTPFN